MPSCSPPRTAPPAPASLSARSPSTASTGSPSSACSQTTQRRTRHAPGAPSAPATASDAASPAPTGPRPTAQSRSTDQNTPARVGLPLPLPNQPPPRQSPPQLHPLVQPTTTPHSPRRPTTHQPRRGPPWSVQLAPADEARPATVLRHVARAASDQRQG
jgi:hypothetical protein